MGSPLSVVVAEIVMQNIEEAPFRPADKRYRFGYATLTILSPPYDTTKSTHSTTTLTVKALTNSLRGVEENGKLPFLDCLVNRDDNSLRITVYRKPTHTDRLLDESSYNPTSHKATTIRTLTRRAQLVCNTTDSLSDENKYLNFIRRNTHGPTTTTEANDNATHTTTATIPYIKGISENISRILQPFNIRVAHKPITTLRQLLTNVKDKDESRNRQGAVFKVNCSDCHASCFGEIDRNLTTRLTEHKRATRKGDANNLTAEHHQLRNYEPYY